MATTTRTGLLTERDREIVAWLGRLPGASVEQIRGRFGLGRSQAYRRVQVLSSFGLVQRLHLLAGRPALYAVRGQSLRPASYEHALALAELIVAREPEGAVIATDQELRRERNGEEVVAARLGDDRCAVVGACRRIPDAVELLPGGGLLAYEIELSSKGRSRRTKILSTYAASGYERVRWLVPDSRLAALIATEIEAMGLGGFMEVADGRQVGL